MRSTSYAIASWPSARCPRVPLVVFVEDVAASGAVIASAANEIVVDPSSVVGSVGGRRGGVGLHEGDEEVRRGAACDDFRGQQVGGRRSVS